MTRARFQEVHPVLPVRGVAKAVAFYTERLGFRLEFQDSPDTPRYAGVERDGVRLHLQWHDPVDYPGVENQNLGLRFLIEDVDDLFAEYRDKGVFHAGTDLRDTPWGTREFAFYDPDGNGLFFYRNR